MTTQRPLIIAHRGASAYRPENTLPAVHLALEQQADMIEFDVRTSRDGALVVIHDECLKRTTNSEGTVSGRTLSELKILDAGYWFDPEGNETFPFRGRGAQIPALEEVLKDLPQCNLALEIKENSEDTTHRVMKLLKRYAAHNRTIVGSKYHTVAKTLRKHYSGCRRFLSRRDIIKTLFEKSLPGKNLMECPGAIASVPLQYWRIRFDTESWIRHLHQKRALAFFWTGTDCSVLESLMQKGADGFVTDDPAFTRKVILRQSGTAPTND